MKDIDTRPRSSRSRRRKPPKVRARDFRLAYLYGLAALAVRVLPQSRWESAALWLSRLDPSRNKSRDNYDRYQAGFRAVHGDATPDAEIRQLFDRASLLPRRADLYLAAFRRNASWSPKIDLIGSERLDEALVQGQGVILWFDNFPLSSLPGKRALAEAGYPMWYLSGYAHGFSYTRLSAWMMNWRLIEMERRHLAARLVFSEDSVLSVVKAIVGLLRDNKIVGIANNAVMGKTIFVPFTGGTYLKVAPSPLNIAASKGAALLPVAVIEVKPFSHFEVRIGQDLRNEVNLDGEDSTMAMASAYARYLHPVLRAHGENWDWSGLSFADELPK